MPPRLPDTQGQRKLPSSQRNVRGYSTAASERANNISAQMLGDAASDLGDIASDRMRRDEEEGRRKAQEAKTRREAIDKGAVLNAQERENMAQRRMLDLMYGTDDEPGLYQATGSKALNLESDFEARWQPLREEMMAGVENPVAKKALEDSLDSMYETTLGNVKRHRNAEQRSYFTSLNEDKIEIENSRVGFDWKSNDSFKVALDNVRGSASALATSQGVPAAPIVNKQVSQLYMSRISGMLNSNDAGTILDAQDLYNQARRSGDISDFSTAMKIEKMLDGVVPAAAARHAYDSGIYKSMKTDKEDIMRFVIQDIEGGDEVVQEPNGGIAKHGINSVAHPDVDVANLDEAGALGILDEKYWDYYELDDIPDDMKLIAFDTVVNHRSDFALYMQQKIRDGASPQDVLNERLKEYQRLVKADPEKYGKYYAGWKNRLEKLSDQMVGITEFDEKKLYASASQLDKRYPGAGAELIKLHEEQRKRMDAAKKAEKDAVQDEVLRIVSENNGDYTQIPASVRARAAQLNIDITQYKGVSDADTLNDLEAMSTDQFFNVDLNDPIYLQNLTYDDLQTYKEKQQDLQKPESKQLQEKIDSTVRYYYQADLGKNPDDKKVKDNVAAMKRYVEFEAQKLYEKTQSVTDADISKMAADFFKNRKYDAGIFSFEEKNIYAMPVSDIPNDIRKAIEQSLLNENKLVTDESVKQRYIMHLRRQGQVKRTD